MTTSRLIRHRAFCSKVHTRCILHSFATSGFFLVFLVTVAFCTAYCAFSLLWKISSSPFFSQFLWDLYFLLLARDILGIEFAIHFLTLSWRALQEVPESRGRSSTLPQCPLLPFSLQGAVRPRMAP